MRSIANWKALLALALAGCLPILFVACGSNSSSSSSGSSTASSEESSGGETAEIVPAPPTTPISEFPVTEPIKETPPAKQNVIWLACELGSCQGDLSKGYTDAAAALGWGFEQINYNPLKASEGVQQALNKNPDAIFITGIDPAYFEAQAKEAIKKEIPIFNGFSTEEPEPTKNGVYMNYLNSYGYGLEAKQIASWIINDSGGKANVATVVIPEYPILEAEVTALEEQFAECPECSIGKVAVTVEDVGAGKVAAKVVAYLQTHPEVNYIEFTFGDLLPGVEAALKSSGLGGTVKFTGVQSNPAIVKEITEGKVAAWTAQPQQFQGWLSVDAAIRVAQGLPITKYEESGEVPTWVIDSKEEAEGVLEEGGEWPGPEGFQEKFEELWGL
jgi:ribose transport system substrate-binding protein